MPVSVIILAAGASSRMGQSKQLLPWKNGTLLSHAVNTAMASRAGKVYVVLGKDKDLVNNLPVSKVINDEWEKGIGSSIKAGLRVASDSEAVLFMTCDMPFVTPEHLNNLIATDKPVVASKYLDTIGIPALFKKEIFDKILALDDSEGAKKLISKDAALVVLAAGDDLDTPEDYRKALSN